ncbi:MAG TPA: hypothetical protein PLW31_03850 [Bacteroidales bacterium]|nr:hypothetical protein [Bacteroidales bacterium]
MRFLLSFLILAASVLQGQNIVRYEKNHRDTELCKITFIDTTTNEIVKTFSPAEKCPYWNLTYKRIGDTINDRSVKYFDLKGIDSLTGDEIPGLINVTDFGHPLKQPYEAFTSNSAHVSKNGKWVIISSHIIIDDFSDDENESELEAYAECLQVFDSNGNLFRKIFSDDAEMNDVGITDDGDYLFYDYQILKDLYYDNHSNRNPGLRIINLKTMDIELDISDYDTNWVYLYPYVAGDFICIFSETRKDYEDVDSTGCNSAVCYNFKKNIKYTGPIGPAFKEFWRIIDVSDEGIYFRVSSAREAQPVLYRFDKDFTKEKIK